MHKDKRILLANVINEGLKEREENIITKKTLLYQPMWIKGK